MATKQRIHQLIDALPDTPETELRLAPIKDQLEPAHVVAEPAATNGAAKEARIRRPQGNL